MTPSYVAPSLYRSFVMSPPKRIAMMKPVRMIATLMALGALAAPRASQAQTFKVEKWNIGGEGGTDYLTAEPGTGRVFVSRGTHVMVVDGATGKVLGDIQDTPRTHGIALAAKA